MNDVKHVFWSSKSYQCKHSKSKVLETNVFYLSTFCENCRYYFQDLGAESLFENVPVVQKSDVVIVSVKPSVVPVALGDIKKAPNIKADKLFLSIAMGVTIKQLEQVTMSGTKKKPTSNKFSL